ncbi:MAG: hypothetical protein ABIF77_21850 [bacterium]
MVLGVAEGAVAVFPAGMQTLAGGDTTGQNLVTRQTAAGVELPTELVAKGAVLEPLELVVGLAQRAGGELRRRHRGQQIEYQHDEVSWTEGHLRRPTCTRTSR